VELLPGVHLVTAPYTNNYPNQYVVTDKERAVMIDCGYWGYDATLDVVIKNCQAIGFDIAELSACFITHAHFDHSSHAYQIQAMGVPLYACRETADAVKQGDRRCIAYMHVQEDFRTFEIDHIISD
jgi:glyoxylase-like metal-dependent hydrolase (beta-lactamase superfamily II)